MAAVYSSIINQKNNNINKRSSIISLNIGSQNNNLNNLVEDDIYDKTSIKLSCNSNSSNKSKIINSSNNNSRSSSIYSNTSDNNNNNNNKENCNNSVKSFNNDNLINISSKKIANIATKYNSNKQFKKIIHKNTNEVRSNKNADKKLIIFKDGKYNIDINNIIENHIDNTKELSEQDFINSILTKSYKKLKKKYNYNTYSSKIHNKIVLESNNNNKISTNTNKTPIEILPSNSSTNNKANKLSNNIKKTNVLIKHRNSIVLSKSNKCNTNYIEEINKSFIVNYYNQSLKNNKTKSIVKSNLNNLDKSNINTNYNRRNNKSKEININLDLDYINKRSVIKKPIRIDSNLPSQIRKLKYKVCMKAQNQILYNAISKVNKNLYNIRNYKKLKNIQDSESEVEDFCYYDFIPKWYSLNPKSYISVLNKILYEILIVILLMTYPMELVYFNFHNNVKINLFLAFIETALIISYLINFITGCYEPKRREINYNMWYILTMIYKDNSTYWVIYEQIALFLNNYVITLISVMFNLSKESIMMFYFIVVIYKLLLFLKLNHWIQINSILNKINEFMTSIKNNSNKKKKIKENCNRNSNSLSNKIYNNFVIFLKNDKLIVYSYKVFVFIRVVLYYVLLIHISSCIWIYMYKTEQFYNNNNHWISNMELVNEDNTTIYVASFYYCVTTLFSVGYGDIRPFNNTERIFSIIFMTIGLLFYSFLVTLTSLVVAKNNIKETLLKEKLIILKDIKDNHNINKNLYNKIHNAIKHTNKSYNSDKILLVEDLPSNLKDAIVLKIYDKKVKSLNYFNNLENKNFLLYACSLLKTQVYDKNYKLLYANQRITEIYFIAKGEILLSLDDELDNYKIARVFSREHFGDDLVDREVTFSPYNIEAKKSTNEIYTISIEKYFIMKNRFPKVIKSIKLSTQFRDNLIEEFRLGALNYFKIKGTLLGFYNYSMERMNKEIKNELLISYDEKSLIKDSGRCKKLNKTNSNVNIRNTFNCNQELVKTSDSKDNNNKDKKESYKIFIKNLIKNKKKAVMNNQNLFKYDFDIFKEKTTYKFNIKNIFLHNNNIQNDNNNINNKSYYKKYNKHISIKKLLSGERKVNIKDIIKNDKYDDNYKYKRGNDVYCKYSLFYTKLYKNNNDYYKTYYNNIDYISDKINKFAFCNDNITNYNNLNNINTTKKINICEINDFRLKKKKVFIEDNKESLIFYNNINIEDYNTNKFDIITYNNICNSFYKERYRIYFQNKSCSNYYNNVTINYGYITDETSFETFNSLTTNITNSKKQTNSILKHYKEKSLKSLKKIKLKNNTKLVDSCNNKSITNDLSFFNTSNLINKSFQSNYITKKDEFSLVTNYMKSLKKLNTLVASLIQNNKSNNNSFYNKSLLKYKDKDNSNFSINNKLLDLSNINYNSFDKKHKDSNITTTISNINYNEDSNNNFKNLKSYNINKQKKLVSQNTNNKFKGLVYNNYNININNSSNLNLDLSDIITSNNNNNQFISKSNSNNSTSINNKHLTKHNNVFNNQLSFSRDVNSIFDNSDSHNYLLKHNIMNLKSTPKFNKDYKSSYKNELNSIINNYVDNKDRKYSIIGNNNNNNNNNQKSVDNNNSNKNTKMSNMLNVDDIDISYMSSDRKNFI